MPKIPPTKILLLGSTLAAHTAIQAFAKPLKQGQVDVTVLSESNHCLLPELMVEMITGHIGPHNVMESARRLLHPAALHIAEIEQINLAQRKIDTYHSLNGRRQTLAYDHLIIAVSPECETHAYPGFLEHGYRLLTYEEAVRLRNRIITLMELGDGCSDDAERKDLLRFVVVGSGCPGVELACYLAEYQRQLIKQEYDQIRPEECQVILLDSGSEILTDLKPLMNEATRQKIVQYTHEQFKRLGIHYIPNVGLKAITDQYAALNNGERIPSRAIIVTDAACPPQYLQQVLPNKNSLRTNNFLQLEGSDNVWLIGDYARIGLPATQSSPVWKSRQTTAETVTTNILRHLKGDELLHHQPLPGDFFLPLGADAAAGIVNGQLLTGQPALRQRQKQVMRLIPRWDRRIRLRADRAIWGKIGHDIVAMETRKDSHYDILHIHAEDGTILHRPGQHCQHTYSLLTGQVQISCDGLLLHTLQPGDHFGSGTGFDLSDKTVIAKGKTTILQTPIGQRDDLNLIFSSLENIQPSGDHPHV